MIEKGSQPPAARRPLIREFSAGGVCVRNFRGRPFVAVVEPRAGVLALPKGHPDGKESSAEAAARELREEAGVVGELVEKLGDIRYWYAREGERVLKIVSFFLFRYRSGSVRDHDHEVESAAWLPLAELVEKLSYKGEREMAAAALTRLAPDR
jgi:8-oxo-dGTP pyrophosphatase MutT (NUDIX family)